MASQKEDKFTQDDEGYKKLFGQLLRKNKGIAIGEFHHHRAQYKVIIDSIATMAENGLNVIVMEHFEEDVQKYIDEFLGSKVEDIGSFPNLQRYLLASHLPYTSYFEEKKISIGNRYDDFIDKYVDYMTKVYEKDLTLEKAYQDTVLDQKHKKDYALIEKLVNKELEHPYNLIGLLRCCREQNIRVIGADQEKFKDTFNPFERYKLLNDQMVSIAEKLPEKEKYIIWAGATHIEDWGFEKTHFDGIKTRLGCPHINILNGVERNISITSGSKAEHHTFDKSYRADYLVKIPKKCMNITAERSKDGGCQIM